MAVQTIKYMLKYYIRAFKYIAPVLTFIVFIGISYSYKYVAIWSSYLVSSFAVFAISAWISMGFAEFEDITQQQLTIIHIGSEIAYYLLRILSAWLFILPLDLLAVILPITLRVFNRTITVSEIFLALGMHALYSILGIATALLFDLRVIQDRKKAIVLLLLLVFASIVQPALILDYPFIKYIAWILPPVNFLSNSLNSLGRESVYSFNTESVIFILYTFVYSTILCTGYIVLMKKRKF